MIYKYVQKMDPYTYQKLLAMDSKFYKAASKGEIEPFDGYTQPLNLLLTPTKNTILHIHITQQPKGESVSISFMEQILAKCPSLLLQTNDRGETPLHIAARHGLDAMVQFLIDYVRAEQQDIEIGANVGAARAMLRMENTDKETALHEAVRHNNLKVVQILTKEDPDFAYLANRSEESPLYLAVERGYRNVVFQILDTCTSPVYHGPNGRTALHEAVMRNYSELAAKILEVKKTLVKEVDQQGWTLLHHASYFGHLSIVKQLLECDKSAAYNGDKHGMTPLHLAAACGDSHENVVFALLEHCPDCHELVDHKGRNALHFAVMSESSLLLSQVLDGPDNDDCYLPLLANLVNRKDTDGNTPLHLLATCCLENTALISHPLADKMAVNNNNHTPLDVISETTDNINRGFKGDTLKYMKRDGGYKESLRNVFEVRDETPVDIDLQRIEKLKTSHSVVAALIVTVAFTAGFTVPGGYNGNDGNATLSRKGAFATFIITDALAFILSTCALLFYFFLEVGRVTNRRKANLLSAAALLLILSMFFMVIAFASAVFAVLHLYISELFYVLSPASLSPFSTPK